MTTTRFACAVTGLFATLVVSDAAQARDASRNPVLPGQTAPQAIPNPYLPTPRALPSTGDRAADAYATGFAIGLGSVLLNRQRPDEVKREPDQKR